jgi:hypothetical protein
MKRFGEFFKKKRMNKLLESGEKLVPSAHILAIGSYTQFLDKYAVIDQIDPKQWDFVITIAGVFIAVSQLNHENISDSDKDVLLDKIKSVAVEMYPDFVEACEDCRKFVDRTYDGLVKEYQGNEQFLFSDALGTWVVWNLFEHASSSGDERKLIRSIGVFLIHSFFSWWK